MQEHLSCLQVITTVMRNIIVLFLPLLLLSGCTSQQPVARQATPGSHSERTAVGPEDVRITQDLRRLILADPQMSVNARNIFISTRGGVTTLSGAVDDEAEKSSVVAKARQVPGVKRINNQLEPLVKSVAGNNANVR
jgi:osmotically-inducible protein OsmY